MKYIVTCISRENQTLEFRTDTDTEESAKENAIKFINDSSYGAYGYTIKHVRKAREQMKDRK